MSHRLRRARNPADYDDRIDAVEALTQVALADARLVAGLLRGL